MKVCRNCLINKEDSEFRIRHDKRSGISRLNNTCRFCDAEYSRMYYDKHKNDPAFKEKNVKRVRAYAHKNVDVIKVRRQTKEYLEKHAKWELNRYYRMKDVINGKAKVKRQTPEYKAKMKAYREKNKEKIFKQEVVTKKRYHEKHRDNLTDKYIIRQLISQDVATREVLLAHPEIIEAKRLQLLIIRNNKTKNNGN